MTQDNITKLLDLFVAEKDSLRPIFEKPFRGCGVVCATDMYTGVIIDESEVPAAEQYPLRERDVKVLAEIPTDYTNRLSHAAIKEALSKVPQVEETVDESKECEECDGMGVVEWEYHDSDGNYHYADHDCPVCDGKGQIGNQERKTGRMISDPKATFHWGAGALRASVLDKLRQAMEIAGMETAPVTMHNTLLGAGGGEVMQLSEHVRVVFMPLTKPYRESTILNLEEL